MVLGRTGEIKVTMIGNGVPLAGVGVPVGLAVGVSVGAISVVVIILLILFMFWKIKYLTYTQIERREDGAGKCCLLVLLHFDLLLNERINRVVLLHKV